MNVSKKELIDLVTIETNNHVYVGYFKSKDEFVYFQDGNKYILNLHDVKGQVKIISGR